MAAAAKSLGDTRPSVELIKSRIDLAALVERDGVKLKRRGREYVGLSPFTAERTPSFTIYSQNGVQKFKCFSSGRMGDAIDWLIWSRSLDTAGAIAEARVLAGLGAGVTTEADRAKMAERRRVDSAAAAKRAADVRSRKRNQAAVYWSEAAPWRDSPVETYLKSRGICPATFGAVLGDMDGLRFSKGVRNRSGEYLPAMLCAVRAPTGTFLAVHATFLSPNGRALDLSVSGPDGSRAKKQIFGAYKPGASLLVDRRHIGQALGAKRESWTPPALFVGEGIESVLSALLLASPDDLAGPSLWVAALSLDNLQGGQMRNERGDALYHDAPPATLPKQPCADPDNPGFLPTQRPARTVILADNDFKPMPAAKGRPALSSALRAERAAALCADKFSLAECGPVSIRLPSPGHDFNDDLCARLSAGAPLSNLGRLIPSLHGALQ